VCAVGVRGLCRSGTGRGVEAQVLFGGGFFSLPGGVSFVFGNEGGELFELG